MQHAAQLALRKALAMHPDDVGLGQVDEQPARIFTKGHARVCQALQVVGVRKNGLAGEGFGLAHGRKSTLSVGAGKADPDFCFAAR